MTAYKIDHIGIAVVSIDDAIAVYRALGLEEEHREEVPAQKVVTAFLPAGESRSSFWSRPPRTPRWRSS